jgi:hypothetical protein
MLLDFSSHLKPFILAIQRTIRHAGSLETVRAFLTHSKEGRRDTGLDCGRALREGSADKQQRPRGLLRAHRERVLAQGEGIGHTHSWGWQCGHGPGTGRGKHIEFLAAIRKLRNPKASE